MRTTINEVVMVPRGRVGQHGAMEHEEQEDTQQVSPNAIVPIGAVPDHQLDERIMKIWGQYRRDRRALGEALAEKHDRLAKRGSGGMWIGFLRSCGIPKQSAERLVANYRVYRGLPEVLKTAAERAGVDLLRPMVIAKLATLQEELHRNSNPDAAVVEGWVLALQRADESDASESSEVEPNCAVTVLERDVSDKPYEVTVLARELPSPPPDVSSSTTKSSLLSSTTPENSVAEAANDGPSLPTTTSDAVVAEPANTINTDQYPAPYKLTLDTNFEERERYEAAIRRLHIFWDLDSEKEVLLTALLADFTDDEWKEFRDGMKQISKAYATNQYKNTILAALRAALAEVRRARTAA